MGFIAIKRIVYTRRNMQIKITHHHNGSITKYVTLLWWYPVGCSCQFWQSYISPNLVIHVSIFWFMTLNIHKLDLNSYLFSKWSNLANWKCNSTILPSKSSDLENCEKNPLFEAKATNSFRRLHYILYLKYLAIRLHKLGLWKLNIQGRKSMLLFP